MGSHYTATFMAYKREDIDAMSYDARASFMDRLISEPREPAAAVEESSSAAVEEESSSAAVEEESSSAAVEEDSSCIADPDDPDAYDLIMGFMENFLAKNILFHLHLDTIRAGTRAAISGTAFLLLMIGVTALD